MAKIYAMNCPQCGAALQIPSDIEYCNCSFCGSSLKIDVKGGAVILSEIAQNVKVVNDSVHRTEKKIDVLSRELRELNRKINPVPKSTPEPELDLESSSVSTAWFNFSVWAGALLFLASIWAMSGIGYAFFWAPFLMRGVWGSLTGVDIASSYRILGERDKRIVGFFNVWMLLTVFIAFAL